jgi:hypothetical protein
MAFQNVQQGKIIGQHNQLALQSEQILVDYDSVYLLI